MTTGSPLPTCAHCGLPVRRPVTGQGEVFCCYGCYLVRRLIGHQGPHSVRAWHLLRLGIGAFLAMDVMMVSLLLYTGAVEPQEEEAFRLILLGLSAPAMAVLLYPFILGAAGEIRRGRLSLDTLIALGASAAFGVSAANVLRGRGEVYFDTATMLLVLVTVGRFIEASAKTRAAELLRSLESLLPGQATRLESAGPREVPLKELRPGDHLLVRPGERFAADGVILEGQTVVEQAQFTGEAEPQPLGVGEEVIAGTVNAQSPVIVQVEHAGEEMLVRRLVAAVQQAQQEQPPLERLAGRMATAFVPAVLVLAAASGLYWWLFGTPSQAGMAALAVLVVACPCAMGIAAPLANALAIAHAAAHGIVVRGGDVLENIGRVGTVFFDKTGTLTQGQPRVLKVRTCDDPAAPEDPADELLAHLAALESRSEHSLARAVLDEASRRGLEPSPARDVQALPGLGLRGTVQTAVTLEVLAGSPEYLASALGQSCDGASSRDGPCQTLNGIFGNSSATVIQVAWGGRFRGCVSFQDARREDAAQAIHELRQLGIQIAMVSGDSRAPASSVAEALGIDQVHAPCLPDGKLRLLRAAGSTKPVAMVGDGVNDAPALAAADIGIALAAGTDLAQQAGNVVLLRNSLVQIPYLIRLSRRARRVIVQNLLWALGYNAIALAAAAAGMLHPLLAAVAMAASSVTVLANSCRVKKENDLPQNSQRTQR